MNISFHNSAGVKNYSLAPYAAAGFTYIVLLIYIAIMGTVLASVGEVWHTTMQREKEQELLFVGNQFRRAINQYSKHAQLASDRFPTTLNDLLKDPRYPDTRRYLRKIYIDPMTGSAEWGLVKGPNGEIFGVYSRSEEEPVKQHNFSIADTSFEDKLKYSDWVFMSIPVRTGVTVPMQP